MLVSLALILSSVGPARADGPADTNDPSAVTGAAAPSKPATAPARKFGVAALPIVFVSPETDLAVGALGFAYFYASKKPDTRPSEVRGSFTYTTLGQALADVSNELWLDDDRTHTLFVANGALFPQSFWGVGNSTSGDAIEDFTEQSFATSLSVERRIWKRLYVGGRALFDLRRYVDATPGGLMDRGAVVGASGGRTVSIGPKFLWDSRDRTYSPLRGSLVELSQATSTPIWGSEFRFSKVVFDGRTYLRTWREQVLALQFYFQAVSVAPPFYWLSTIGGEANLRGFYTGRYRDKVYVSAQAEYRLPLFWRFGMVAFAGAGRVAPDVGELDPRGLHVAGGLGLRFRISDEERLNIAADIAVNDDLGFAPYLNVGEAF